MAFKEKAKPKARTKTQTKAKAVVKMKTKDKAYGAESPSRRKRRLERETKEEARLLDTKVRAVIRRRAARAAARRKNAAAAAAREAAAAAASATADDEEIGPVRGNAAEKAAAAAAAAEASASFSSRGAGLRDVFREFDSDGRGVLSRRDFADAMYDLGFRLSHEEEDRLMDRFAGVRSDGAGGFTDERRRGDDGAMYVEGGDAEGICYAAFLRFFGEDDSGLAGYDAGVDLVAGSAQLLVSSVRTKLAALRVGPSLRRQFTDSLKGGDGYLTADELRKVLTRKLGIARVSEGDLEFLLKRMDVDGDGRVDYGDLVAFVEGDEGGRLLSTSSKLAGGDDADDDGRGGSGSKRDQSSFGGSAHLSEALERVRKTSKDKWSRQALCVVSVPFALFAPRYRYRCLLLLLLPYPLITSRRRRQQRHRPRLPQFRPGRLRSARTARVWRRAEEPRAPPASTPARRSGRVL